jgi:hypothetical protein
MSILMMCGVTFTQLDSGAIQVKEGDVNMAKDRTRTTEEFEKLGGEPALDAIVIMDGTEGKE